MVNVSNMATSHLSSTLSHQPYLMQQSYQNKISSAVCMPMNTVRNTIKTQHRLIKLISCNSHTRIKSVQLSACPWILSETPSPVTLAQPYLITPISCSSHTRIKSVQLSACPWILSETPSPVTLAQPCLINHVPCSSHTLPFFTDYQRIWNLHAWDRLHKIWVHCIHNWYKYWGTLGCWPVNMNITS